MADEKDKSGKRSTRRTGRGATKTPLETVAELAQMTETARESVADSPEHVRRGVVTEQPITQTLERNYLPYMMSVIVSRAIPEIDGLKPSHRRILYTMYKMGLLRGNRTKSANVVGQTMKLNPHGDQAIYETMVRMTRGNGALNCPWIDSKGNMGRFYSRDMQFAAPRYTEVKLEKICEELFRSIDSQTVPFVPNYDNTMEEPLLLPCTFPSILANSNQGIAVGMASNIAPFNLEEICQATMAWLHDPGVDLLEYMPAPDFPGGCKIVQDESVLRQIYRSGTGTLRLRAVYEVSKTDSRIIITAIPYTSTVESIIDDLTNLFKKGQIKEVTDVRDETDLRGMRISIDVKRGTDCDQLMQQLYRQSGLENTFACNFNILINGTPRRLGVTQIIGEWVNFRRVCLRNEIGFKLGEAQERLHILNGLALVLLDIDRAIAVIRNTEKEADVIPALCDAFGIDNRQAEYIAEIKLRNLNREYLLRRTSDREEVEKRIRELQEYLADTQELDKLIIADLERIIKDYPQPRLSELIQPEEAKPISAEELIPDFNLRLFLTEQGYLKKIALTSLRNYGELKMKEGDQIIQDLEATNRSEIILLSTKRVAYKISASQLPDHRPSDWGEYLGNLLELEEDEEIVFMHAPSEDYGGSLVFAYADGRVSRVLVKAYETKQNRRRLLNSCGGSATVLGGVYLEEGEEKDLFILSKQGKILVFDSALIPTMQSRANQGIRVFRTGKNDRLLKIRSVAGGRLEDPDYYRVRTLPSVGRYAKEESLIERLQELQEVATAR